MISAVFHQYRILFRSFAVPGETLTTDISWIATNTAMMWMVEKGVSGWATGKLHFKTSESGETTISHREDPNRRSTLVINISQTTNLRPGEGADHTSHGANSLFASPCVRYGFCRTTPGNPFSNRTQTHAHGESIGQLLRRTWRRAKAKLVLRCCRSHSLTHQEGQVEYSAPIM